MSTPPEVWLRGSVPGVPSLLQPAAHAVLQAREDVERLARNLPVDRLWARPAGVASIGFHLRHLAGVLDRLATYARGDALEAQQLEYLRNEGVPGEPAATVAELVRAFQEQVDRFVDELRDTPESVLTEARSVGRARFPSTVLGLLFHAAEHTQRHVGQLLVTIRVQQEPSRSSS